MIKVKCPKCGTKYSLDDSEQGRDVQCERCGKIFAASPSEISSGAPAANPGSNNIPIRFRRNLDSCPSCGESISPYALSCPRCGHHKLYWPWLILSWITLASTVIGMIFAFLRIFVRF